MTSAEQPSDPPRATPDGAALARGWLENSPLSVSAEDGPQVALALVTYQL